MKYLKKINNNVAFARDDAGIDYIVLGKGIGFNAQAGEVVPSDNIDRTFRSENSHDDSDSTNILTNISSEAVAITTRVSQYVEDKLAIHFDNARYLILADHLDYAIKRNQEGIEYPPSNQWELKKLFSKEYGAAIDILKIIDQEFQIKLDTAEIGFITNHLVSAGSGFSSLQGNRKMTKLINKIVHLVEAHFQMIFDEDSFNYNKFISHLRYFVLRKMSNDSLPDNLVDKELVAMYQLKYPEAFGMAEKIEIYLSLKEDWTLTLDEKLYLTIHIRRLTAE